MSSVFCQEFAGGRVEIVLNRPQRKNALSRQAAVEFRAAVSASVQAPVVLLRGEGGSFCSGGDLDELHGLAAADLRATMAQVQDALLELSRASALSVAWVEGVALGGGLELALAADLIWMHPQARLRAAQLEMGLVPGWGGLERAIGRLGAVRGRSLFLDPQWISAEQALAVGLVDRVLPDLATAQRQADQLAELAPDAVAAIKRESAVSPGLFARLWEGPAHQQAVARFKASRNPTTAQSGASDHQAGGEPGA
ncbi:MAG: enoyl-CoA hydratase/isomerase family protein [Sulfobacillus sp.]